ncbi:MAG: heavy-metal-associated domain-containing protein [archaeon]|nr:heavy-metal-associated domain-containing protein [archaeon]
MQSQKTMAKGTIHVSPREGRSCRLESVREQVSKIAGISSVEANHVSHALSIEYDPKKITLDQIRKKIEL